MSRYLLVALVVLAACKGEGEKQRERCVATIKMEQKCVPPLPNMSDEGRAINGALSGDSGLDLGVSLCMHQFDDPAKQDKSDKSLGDQYRPLTACAEKSKTCDEYMACACQDPESYIQCRMKK